jgi:hypothetical protein
VDGRCISDVVSFVLGEPIETRDASSSTAAGLVDISHHNLIYIYDLLFL